MYVGHGRSRRKGKKVSEVAPGLWATLFVLLVVIEIHLQGNREGEKLDDRRERREVWRKWKVTYSQTPEQGISSLRCGDTEAQYFRIPAEWPRGIGPTLVS